MLWNSTAEEVVRRVLGGAVANDWSSKCDKWKALHDFLQDKHKDRTYESAKYSHPKVSERWNEGDGSGFLYLPLVRMYAERLSVAFDQPPTTHLRRRGSTERLDEKDPQVQQWRKDERDVQFAATMQQCEEMTTALGQSAIYVSWKGDRIRWKVYAPYELKVVKDTVDPDDFDRAAAIGLEIRTPDRGLELRQWLVWHRIQTSPVDVEWGHGLYDEGGRLLGYPLFKGPADGSRPGLSGYGRHPIILWQWRQPPNGELFNEPDEALLQLQRKVNVHLTDSSQGLVNQVHAQPLLWGNPLGVQEGTLAFGPDVPLQFPGNQPGRDGDLQYRTPQLNIGELLNTIDRWLMNFAVTRGLPPDTFLGNSSTRNLGAKQQETAELDRLRKKRYPIIVDTMRRQFETHKAVGNYWAQFPVAKRIAYDEDVELEVELQPIARVEDRQSKAQADELAIARGQTSTVQLVQQETGVTRAEAQAAVARNLADEGASKPPEPVAPAE